MKAIIGSLMLCVSLSGASAQAQAIYKCVVGVEVTFQQSPCEAPPPIASRPGAASLNAPLLGTWHADHDLTMAWLKQHSKLTKSQESLLDQIVGHMTFTFSAKRLLVAMPDLEVQVDGISQHRPGTHDDLLYWVVAAGAKKILIGSEVSTSNSTVVTEFNFEGRDTMWMLANNGWRNDLDPHAREYFRRVK